MADELFKDGSLSGRGDYDSDGKRHGPWEFWYANGQKKADCTYDAHRLDGASTFWHPNGELLQRGAFDLNTQIGHWERWFDNGQLRDVGDYDSQGKRIGEWKTYDRDGTLKKTTQHRG